MTDIAIRVQGLSKLYRIGERQRYKSLREIIMRTLAAPFRAGERRPPETIWALDDVSFEVMRGKVVGVIGRNGAGKSTLLRILSRITEPTRGRIEVYGRVGSLLEVGTGFHHELTGRENIYLNGAILGMKRAEIERKFDEIVAFAEVEKFLDTPVKHYSTGMYLRLAFSVAAHLEPEILLVDEVLAVGDAAFQKKCLGKMGDVARGGRTVLFVSHNLAAVQALCSRALLLQAGTLVADGTAQSTVAHYLAETGGRPASMEDLRDHPGRTRSREKVLERVWLEDGAGRSCSAVPMGAPLHVRFSFGSSRPIRNPGFGFGIEDGSGRRVFSLNNYMVPSDANTFATLASGEALLEVPALPLLPDTYYVSVSVVEDQREWVDFVERAIAFQVHPSDCYGSGKIPEPSHGVVFVRGSVLVEPTSHDHDAVTGGRGDG